MDDGSFDLKTTVVYLKNQNKYIDYNGGTQHEVEHIYQMIKSGKNLLSNEKSIDLYQKADTIKKSNNVLEKIVAYVIYYSFKFEKDAFSNALYKQIMDNPNTNPYETLKNSVVYINIETLKRYILDTEIYKEKYKDIVAKNFGKTYNWFIRLTRETINCYINKIGKVFAKAKKDLEKNNMPLDGGIFGTEENLIS